MRRFLVGAAVAACVLGVMWACEDTSDIGTPLSVMLVGPETGLAGEGLPFSYQVSGRSLSGIIFLWGDGLRDSIPTAGAQTAMGTRVHTFDSAGVYLVNLTAEDALEGVGNAQVTVTVQSN